MSDARLYFIHALSPLHAGTGQGMGVIDLPIARERATNIPILPGSSLKGVLRDACENSKEWKHRTADIFGSPTTQVETYAGSLVLSDAHLLLLPVRSLAGTFAWVTSPYLLRRAAQDAADGDADAPPAFTGSPLATDTAVGCWTDAASALHIQREGKFWTFLEELDLVKYKSDVATGWANWLGPRIWPNNQPAQEALKQRICIVHDDVLGYLLNTATEITARIRIDDATKTVADGQLWYEEALPTESVLIGLVLGTGLKATPHDAFAAVADLTKNAMQLGGKETVGRGFCRVRLHGPAPAAQAQTTPPAGTEAQS
jgi:CRISPR-associated protein Cmr4